MIADQSAAPDISTGNPALEDSDLVAGLAARGIRHLRVAGNAQMARCVTDTALITALAANPKPRLREALTLLFLRQPQLAVSVPDIADNLAPAAAMTLRHFYAAATYLQRFWHSTLQLYLTDFRLLPDHFGQIVFHLPSPDDHFGEAGLRALAAFFAEQTDHDWLSVYTATMELFLKQLSLEQFSYAR